MKKIALLLATTLSLAACTRERIVPQPVLHEITYSDDFDDNRNNWNFSDPSNFAYGVISDGSFKFDYNDNLYSAYYASKQLDFDSRMDFSLEARIGSNNNMGILFGFDDINGVYGYSVTVDYDGRFAVYDEGGNGYGPEVQEVYPLSTSPAVRGNGDYNVVRIEQRGNNWDIIINGSQLATVPAQNMRGTGIGFVVTANTQGEADYIDFRGFY